MPFTRRLYTVNAIQEAFTEEQLTKDWFELYEHNPNFLSMIWNTRTSDLCQRKVESQDWTQDMAHVKLVEGLTIFYKSMGSRITKELLEVGQNPVLVSLMGVRTPIIEQSEKEEHVDLQAVLLLTAARAVSEVQQFEDRMIFFDRMLEELKLESFFLRYLQDAARRVEVHSMDPFKWERRYEH